MKRKRIMLVHGTQIRWHSPKKKKTVTVNHFFQFTTIPRKSLATTSKVSRFSFDFLMSLHVQSID